MTSTTRPTAWRRICWWLFPPSKIVLRARSQGMFGLAPYTVADWARDHEDDWAQRTWDKPRMECEEYYYRLYREKLALPFHGILLPEVERAILRELASH